MCINDRYNPETLLKINFLKKIISLNKCYYYMSIILRTTSFSLFCTVI